MQNAWKNTAICLLQGYQHDTRAKTGEEYETITIGEVFDLANRPHGEDDKARAPAAIFSTYHEYDAREHPVQRAKGSYVALWADIDEGDHPLSDVISAVERVAESDHAWLIYSTSSAEEAKAQEEQALKVAAEAARKRREERQAKAQRDGSESPIEWFNKQNQVSDMLSECG